ncbi:hypothetical protein GIB67_016617, partial [Kingdonia uniflora]
MFLYISISHPIYIYTYTMFIVRYYYILLSLIFVSISLVSIIVLLFLGISELVVCSLSHPPFSGRLFQVLVAAVVIFGELSW